MLVQKYKDMLSAKSVIRALSEFATARGQEIGYENVFDYSLGNPSVPVPQAFTDCMVQMLSETETNALHGYSPSLGRRSWRRWAWSLPWSGASGCRTGRSISSWRWGLRAPWPMHSGW